MTPATDCTTVGTLTETHDLNLASITAGAVLKEAVIPRTVTNVGSTTATYKASIGVGGFVSEVTPSTLTLAPGGQRILHPSS